ncbi:hypothetical protein L9F63_004472, partial [Diploptera punctata]
MSTIFLLLITFTTIDRIKCQTFPPEFMFGVATASYQVEGAWNYDGKGVNIWDTLTHNHPEYIKDGSNGDVAANSYFKYEEDVQLMKQLGVNFYRFSISWARILPNGHINQPVVTMFHWDLPQTLQDIGGLANIYMADIFVDYARLLLEQFGDRVKWWITFNEPAIYATGYTKAKGFAPTINSPGVGDYLVVHTIILAHAKTYHMYKENFGNSQQGKFGISFNCDWYEPKTNSTEDIETHERAMQFYVVSLSRNVCKEGDYPELVKEIIASKSLAQGFLKSRLPKFSALEVEYIKGTFDFFGLNHYTTLLVYPGQMKNQVPSLEHDHWVSTTMDPNWPGTAGETRRVVPWGIRKVLNWIKNEYGNPPLIITENGVADEGEHNDTKRIYYYTHYIDEVLRSVVEDNCNVIGYTAWSFLDNFEWTSGYTQKFGLYHKSFGIQSQSCSTHSSITSKFKNDFKFGVATAAYQVEGAWNEDGKGPNIWDTLTHNHPNYIEDRSNGDDAAKSYYKYKEDVQLIKQLGVDFYRFSISWARILPKGHINEVNQLGIDYYDKFINELLNNGIQPVVTIFHWDLPQALQDLGGLASKFFVDIFVDYARLLFAKYGDRAKN